LEPEFWHRRWRKNEIAFHLDRVNPLLERYWSRLQIPPAAEVFVPLCGKSRDLSWLHARGYRVLGIELSELALAEFFTDQAITPKHLAWGRGECWVAPGYRLICGDYFDLSEADLADVKVVYDRASLIAFPPEMRPRYVEHLLAVIPQSTPLMLITLEFDPGEMDGPPFSVAEAEIRDLFVGRIIDCWHSEESIENNPGLRRRGLTHLVEKLYRIAPGSIQSEQPTP
jgi:thiopurine S-methyltransferase